MEGALQFFSEYKSFSVILHVFAVVVGMGTALVSDILFTVYIKDKKINSTENKTLETLSRIIWASLLCIVLSGLTIFLSDPLQYANSTKFLVKMSIVFIIILNGYLFWKVTHTSLAKINFTDTDTTNKYVRIRRVSFALGAVSATSWLSVFVVASIQSFPFSFIVTLSVYAIIIIFAVALSQGMEYLITHKK